MCTINYQQQYNNANICFQKSRHTTVCQRYPKLTNVRRYGHVIVNLKHDHHQSPANAKSTLRAALCARKQTTTTTTQKRPHELTAPQPHTHAIRTPHSVRRYVACVCVCACASELSCHSEHARTFALMFRVYMHVFCTDRQTCGWQANKYRVERVACWRW